MMDYIAGLVQRGLISPDVAQGLVQQVADLKNRMPFESGGGAPTNSVFLPRGYGQQLSDRPIHPDVLKAMRQEQLTNPAPPSTGRNIHPDVLKAMSEEQGRAPANQNKTPRDQFIDEYDALVRQKAAKENRSDFRVVPKAKDE